MTDTTTESAAANGAPAPPPPPPPPPRPGQARNRSRTGAVVAGLVVLGVILAWLLSSDSAPAPVASGAVDELVEINPNTWFPPMTNTASALVGPDREARLVFAQKINDLTVQGVEPCEVWLAKNRTYLEISRRPHWSADYPVPVFECARDDRGRFLPPVADDTLPQPNPEGE